MVKHYNAIGIMSGTSLDGLDVAYCEFRLHKNKWEFDILQAETIPYTQVWLQILKEAPLLDGLGLTQVNVSYGHWIGQTAKKIIDQNNLRPKIIASHGHTIFHRPQDKMTLQIGSGAAIAAETGVNTICDFRSLDIALGGQGAPLVPIGDRLLFGKYAACVNIGGFANISYETTAGRTAFDICAANIVLNMLSLRLGFPFDPSGSMAASGSIDNELFNELENLDFYKLEGPKSLGREWVEKHIIPLIEKSKLDEKDLLRTYTEHMASKIGNSLPVATDAQVIVTGGGAHNTFLIDRIKANCHCNIVVPEAKIVDFKESLIFAFLGVLRMEGIENTINESTGALTSSSGGCIYLAPKKALK